jgi:hypothetical protein
MLEADFWLLKMRREIAQGGTMLTARSVGNPEAGALA